MNQQSNRALNQNCLWHIVATRLEKSSVEASLRYWLTVAIRKAAQYNKTK